MSKRIRRAGISSERMFDFVQMFNRVVTLDEEFARQLPHHEFELGFDEAGSIYIDGEPLGVNVKQRYRALCLKGTPALKTSRATASRRVIHPRADDLDVNPHFPKPVRRDRL